VAAIHAKNREARFRTLDVTSREDMKAFMDFGKAGFGRVDVPVNNAGIMLLSPMTALKVDEWDRMIDVNIRGVLNGIAAVLPDMKARGSGHIVNVASIGAHVVVPTLRSTLPQSLPCGRFRKACAKKTQTSASRFHCNHRVPERERRPQRKRPCRSRALPVDPSFFVSRRLHRIR
jgi:NADP-dependent 3-hydroxy acid dehydrogenase YdfG